MFGAVTAPPTEILLLLVPLLLIQLVLIIAALWDLSRPGRRVRGGSRVLWVLVILLANTIGPILYFVVGREESATEPGPEPGSPDAIAGWRSPRTDAAPTEPGAVTSPADIRPPSWSRTPTGGDAIVCTGLTKRYPGDVLALDRLDLTVPEGSVFGLLGPNGAGKTTTLRILAGLTHVSSGTAAIAGVPVEAGSAELGHRLGFLDQDPRFYGWQTGRETLDLVCRLHGMTDEQRRARGAEALALVDLTDAAYRRVATYSGGMRQRLGIATALANRPPVLILDEPVSSLDPEGRRDLLALIAGLRGSATVLFSTHVLADVERICDRVAILDRGRLVVEGPLDDLLERYALPAYRLDPEPGQEAAVERLRARLASADWVDAAADDHGLLRVMVNDPVVASAELLPTIVAEGVALAGFERVRPTLEDVFLRLVGREAGDASR
jgi:ABC-2 type transport system ATP-binding protein